MAPCFTPFTDQLVTVTSHIVFNTVTGNAAFVVRETNGANVGQELLADLDANRDAYRRQLFAILQQRNDRPVPSLIGTVLQVSGYIASRRIAGGVQRYLSISELTAEPTPRVYNRYPQVTAYSPGDIHRNADGGSGGGSIHGGGIIHGGGSTNEASSTNGDGDGASSASGRSNVDGQ
ncbi:hypothetical protein BGZ46_009759 [Entomortierella lignicola]|nr:hypothetical protein BGZ46_009759 [Entomortierella lignicola]